jgi:hypothetical protein
MVALDGVGFAACRSDALAKLQRVRRLCLGCSSTESGRVAPVVSYSTLLCAPPQADAFGSRRAVTGPTDIESDAGGALTTVPLVDAEPRARAHTPPSEPERRRELWAPVFPFGPARCLAPSGHGGAR